MMNKETRKKKNKVPGKGLRVIEADVAGIDLGSRSHFVCGPVNSDGEANVKEFRTTTPCLIALADWLKEQGVKSVAMESTGVYWIPLYDILEHRGFEVILANAKVLSRVPGRKTDMLDCQWIQCLHSCGLLTGSFRPHETVCAWRSLVREKHTLESQRTDWVRRIQKSLDQMNIRVHHAVSDITGLTGMKILRAIVAGERDPMVLAELRNYRCRKSTRQIAEYLQGNWRSEHLFSLAQHLKIYDELSMRICEYEEEILRMVQAIQPDANRELSPPQVENDYKRVRMNEPVRVALFRYGSVDLTRIDGISARTAEIVLSELGSDLVKFPKEQQFVSYVGLAPKMAISGGMPVRKKPKGSAPSRIGNGLRMAAASLRNSETALGAEYRRVARKKGPGVAVFSVARRLAILIYRALRWGTEYVDIGVKAYEDRFKAARLRTCKRMAKELGYSMLEEQKANT